MFSFIRVACSWHLVTAIETPPNQNTSKQIKKANNMALKRDRLALSDAVTGSVTLDKFLNVLKLDPDSHLEDVKILMREGCYCEVKRNSPEVISKSSGVRSPFTAVGEQVLFFYV